MLDHLPERDRPPVKRRLRRAWARDDHGRALEQLRALAAELERRIPAPPLAARRAWRRRSPSPASAIRGSLEAHARVDEPVRVDDRVRPPHRRNVKRWQSGEMACAGPPPACSKPSASSGRIIGYADLAKLAIAIERDLAPAAPTPPPQPERPSTLVTVVTITPGPPPRSSTATGCAQTVGGRACRCRDPTTSSSSPAGVSPVRVAARRPGSRLPASGGNARRRSAASRAPLGEATDRSAASSEACRVVNVIGRREPSPARQGEGHGRGEEPGVQPRGTSRRMGRGTVRRWRRELGRPSPARRSCGTAVGASRPITGDPGKWAASREGVGGGRSTA